MHEIIHKDLAERLVRLGDEIDKMINLTCQAREALENEMFSKDGFLKSELRPSYLQKMNGLARQLDTLVSAKIKWDKNQAALAKHMTPDQEKKAVRDYVRALPIYERMEFLRGEVDYHSSQTETHGRKESQLSLKLDQ